MEKLIKKWKEYKIEKAEFEFYAGGDSMGNTDLYFYDKDDKTINVDDDFKQEVENDIYNNVDFYETSDGHYEGEAGTVTVTLEKEGEEEYLNFSKDSQAEYSNSYTDEVILQLTPEELNYLKDNVETFHVGYEIEFEYNRDMFVSDKMEEIENSIISKIKDASNEHEFEYNGEGEIEEQDELDVNGFTELEDNKISFQLNYRVTEYEDSNW